jgi:hypothetical protein
MEASNRANIDSCRMDKFARSLPLDIGKELIDKRCSKPAAIYYIGEFGSDRLIRSKTHGNVREGSLVRVRDTRR